MHEQLRVLCGSVRRAGTLAVVPQRAWIFSGTVRENILFGRPFVPELYRRTVEVCALQPDLDLMDNGDLSEIGEWGVNLRSAHAGCTGTLMSDNDFGFRPSCIFIVQVSVSHDSSPAFLNS